MFFFKVFIFKKIILLLLIFWQCFSAHRILALLTRDQTHALCIRSTESITGPLGKSQEAYIISGFPWLEMNWKQVYGWWEGGVAKNTEAGIY